METPKTRWITRAEAAKRLNISASMVSRYVHKGMPTRDDKRVPWPDTRNWVKDNIVPQRSGSWQARQQKRSESHADRRPAIDEQAIREDERVRFLHELTTVEQQLDIFRICRECFEMSAAQAFFVAQWVAFMMLANVGDIETDIAGEPTDRQWVAALGSGVDLEALFEEYERRTLSETAPESIHPWK